MFSKTRRGKNCIWIFITFMVFFCAPRLSAQTIPSTDSAENGFWKSWFERSDKTKQEQPHWITPLVTTTPRLDQEFHYDVSWQQAMPGTNYTVNIGYGKGLELIPFKNVQINAAVPPYIVHNNPAIRDGFGDFRMLVKYRLLSANEREGNYIITAFLDVAAPTGQHGNGQSNTILTPVIGYGKGFGHFSVQGTFGVALPTSNESTVGRTYAWNNAFQYHFLRLLWPELEVNETFFQDGKKRRQKTGSPYTGSGRRTIPRHKPPQSDFRCGSSDCCVGISYYSTQFHPFRAVRILNIACKADRILFLASLRE